MGMVLEGQAAATGAGGGGMMILIIYILFFVAMIYFLFVRPSKKQQAQQQELMNRIKPGDSVMTTSGFYGTVIGMEDDTVIVEFGNNKNCRIPMHKKAIADVESADAVYEEAEEKNEDSAEETKAGKKK